MACNSSLRAPVSKMGRAKMIEGNANPFSAASPLCRCSIGLAPILETTKGNITNGQFFIILSGVLIVASANDSGALQDGNCRNC